MNSSRLYSSRHPQVPVEDVKVHGNVISFDRTHEQDPQRQEMKCCFLLWSFNKSATLSCPTDVQVLATVATVPPDAPLKSDHAPSE